LLCGFDVLMGSHRPYASGDRTKPLSLLTN
jgi:hypothetical protein